jgi:hypothetical protein
MQLLNSIKRTLGEAGSPTTLNASQQDGKKNQEYFKDV